MVRNTPSVPNGSKILISTNSSSRILPHLGGSKIVTPTIYIILPSWNHSIVKIMFKVLKILISSSWVNGQYMAEVQRLCVLMEKLLSIYQIKSWYLRWEKICTFYLLNGLLCSQHDPQKLELDEGSHNTLILLLCQCMSCYIQRHLSAYSQTRNVFLLSPLPTSAHWLVTLTVLSVISCIAPHPCSRFVHRSL